MKTIKIFLASSNELENDRMAFCNFVHRLDNVLFNKGIRLLLVQWETMDVSYSSNRRQDEYVDVIKRCDIFIALLHTRLGAFTAEEINLAIEEFNINGLPKVFIYCKDLQQGESESNRLNDFKEWMLNTLGYYWMRYNSNDLLHLHFLMQLSLWEKVINEGLKVEDGAVTFEGLTLANMDELPFAASNKDYQKMSTELLSLSDEIDKIRQRVEKSLDDEGLKDELLLKLKSYKQLKETYTRFQNSLLTTARMIVTMQPRADNSAMKTAIEAFEAGDLEQADALLDELEAESDARLKELEQRRSLVHQGIDALQLQAKIIMEDDTISVSDRISRVIDIYEKADDGAKKSGYRDEKYAQLLFDYAQFLLNYAYYNEALQVFLRQISLSEKIYGIDHPKTALSYDRISSVYASIGDYAKAIEYGNKALSIRENVLGSDHLDTAKSYNNIGSFFFETGNYSKAQEFYLKALAINEKVLDETDPDLASSFSNIGVILDHQGDYEKALEYIRKALEIRQRSLGKNHISTAMSYNNIGMVWFHQENYIEAIKYFQKAECVFEKVLGDQHPDTISIYNNLALAYSKSGDFVSAKSYIIKASHDALANNYDIYFSFSHDKNDIEKASLILRAIEAGGFSCYPREVLVSGESDIAEVENGIKNSKIVVCLFSRPYYEDKLCKLELEKSLVNKNKYVIPISFDDNVPSDFDDKGTLVLQDWRNISEYKVVEERAIQLFSLLLGRNPLSVNQRKNNLEAAREKREGPSDYQPQNDGTEIFISYKRKDGKTYGRILEQALKLRGYDHIFLDYSSIKDGIFSTKIIDAIFSCKDFIVVLTPLALRQMPFEGDWVAREIRTALRYSKKIITIVIGDTFDGWPKDFPIDMDRVKLTHQHKLLEDDYFDNSMDRLSDRLDTQPHRIDGNPLASNKANYKIKVNKKSRLFIDDEEVTVLDSNKLVKIPLSEGEYLRKVQDYEVEENYDEKEIQMGLYDKVERIQLK